VAEAIRLSRRLRILYCTPGSEPASRDLDPYHGVRFEGDWYVVGHCHLRNEIRTFSLARMENIAVLKDTFRIPDDFDFTRLSGSHFGVHWSNNEYQVSIRFDREVAGYIRERRWHPTQRIDEHPDRSLTLSLTVNHLLELKRWVLSWGNMAQVIAPRSFVDEVKKTIDGMIGKYHNHPD